jgi:hypothetical protein
VGEQKLSAVSMMVNEISFDRVALRELGRIMSQILAYRQKNTVETEKSKVARFGNIKRILLLSKRLTIRKNAKSLLIM